MVNKTITHDTSLIGKTVITQMYSRRLECFYGKKQKGIVSSQRDKSYFVIFANKGKKIGGYYTQKEIISVLD